MQALLLHLMEICLIQRDEQVDEFKSQNYSPSLLYYGISTVLIQKSIGFAPVERDRFWLNEGVVTGLESKQRRVGSNRDARVADRTP